jgi:hypothetical protein
MSLKVLVTSSVAAEAMFSPVVFTNSEELEVPWKIAGINPAFIVEIEAMDLLDPASCSRSPSASASILRP